MSDVMGNNDSFRSFILARLAYITFFTAWPFLKAVNCFCRVFWGSRSTKRKLCIEAGVRGWESIEFKELYKCACEYVGEGSVHKLVVRPDLSYLMQVNDVLRAAEVSHYVYDPRTGDQGLLRGMVQSFLVAVLLVRYDVVPVVLLTDLSVRTWRCQAAVVSAIRGCVVCFMAPKMVQPIFPHRRLIGPSLMPFSQETFCHVSRLSAKRVDSGTPKAIFAGSLYEPRTTTLNEIQCFLKGKDVLFEVKGRVLGGARISDDEYWERLCFSDIIFTTADQMIQSGTDWTHIPHLVYRYLEALVSGSMLIAQAVPSVERYFTPGEHFVKFENAEQAASLIEYYLNHPEERLNIANAGRARAKALIESRCFWVNIDCMLGRDCIN
ncbi:MAG: glycosyltransferase [Verrucomicrobiota bacterium]